MKITKKTSTGAQPAPGATAQIGATAEPAETATQLVNDGEKLPDKIKPGVIDAPATPPSMQAVATDARLVAAPFNSFMKVRRFEVDIQRPGVDGVSTVQVDIVNGPGHNCSMAAPIVLGTDGAPALVLKAGDTRAARKLRGQDYVKIGMIGGRWDKVGADPQKIGIEELAEEIGAQALPGGYLPLGTKLVPTMPGESTEADRYFAAVVQIDGHATGDASGMEVVGLMGPVTMSIADALAAMDNGDVGEGARARVAYARGLDAIGFIPELNAYVHDLPGPLKKRFDTLGLGDAIDPRKLDKPPPAEAQGVGQAPAQHDNAAQVDDVAFLSQTDVTISDHATMLDAQTTHLATGVDGVAQAVGDPFPNQIYHLDYDRAKVVVFHDDAVRGPMVKMSPTERPALAAKALALDGERTYKDENTNLVALDVDNLKIELDGATGDKTNALADAAVVSAFGEGSVKRLGAACDASPGQSDLRFHFFANQIETPKDKTAFVPLSEAIAACRDGAGDAATEALLLRLAADQRWIPSLGMSVDRAKKMAG